MAQLRLVVAQLRHTSSDQALPSLTPQHYPQQHHVCYSPGCIRLHPMSATWRLDVGKWHWIANDHLKWCTRGKAPCNSGATSRANHLVGDCCAEEWLCADAQRLVLYHLLHHLVEACATAQCQLSALQRLNALPPPHPSGLYPPFKGDSALRGGRGARTCVRTAAGAAQWPLSPTPSQPPRPSPPCPCHVQGTLPACAASCALQRHRLCCDDPPPPRPPPNTHPTPTTNNPRSGARISFIP